MVQIYIFALFIYFIYLYTCSYLFIQLDIYLYITFFLNNCFLCRVLIRVKKKSIVASGGSGGLNSAEPDPSRRLKNAYKANEKYVVGWKNLEYVFRKSIFHEIRRQKNTHYQSPF